LMGIFTLIFNLGKFSYCYFKIFRHIYIDDVGQTLSPDQNFYLNTYETSYSHILSTGIRLFFIGIAAMVVWNSDNFVISHYLGFSGVTPYSITFKLNFIFFNLIFMFNTSVFPIMAKEFGMNNWEWINKTFNTFLISTTVIGGFAWIGGIFFLRDLLEIWTSGKGYAGLLTIWALGGYSYLLSMVNLNAGIITSFNLIKHAAWLGWLEAIIKISFSVLFLKCWGIGGVALGTMVGSLLAPSWILPLWLVRRSGQKLTYNIQFIVTHFIFALLPMIIIGLLTQYYVNYSIYRIVIGCACVATYLFLSLRFTPSDVVQSFKGSLPRRFFFQWLSRLVRMVSAR